MAAQRGGPVAAADRDRETPSAEPAGPPRPSRDRLALAIGALVLVPVALAAVRGLLTPWTPVSDQAFEVLRMHDVGTRHTPLIGPYSRLGWTHPGPLLFWAGAPVLRLLGPSGVLFAVGLANLASLAGALAAARLLGGRLLASAVGATAAVMVHHLGPERLVDPWNPYVTYLPLLCFLLSAAAAAEGGARWPLPVAVITGSFVVQSHLGTAAVVAGGAVAATAWWWRARPAGSRLPRPWRTGALALVLWSGPLLDQVLGRGNLTDIAAYFLRGEDERPSLAAALGTAARELGFRPAWAGGPEVGLLTEVVPAPTWTLAISAALLGLAWLAARRAGDLTAQRLVAYGAWLALVSIFAITRTTNGLLAYVLRWTWPVGALGAAVVVFGLGRLAARWSPRSTTEPTVATRSTTPTSRGSTGTRGGPVALVALLAAVAVAASLATTIDSARAELRPTPAHSRTARALSEQVRAKLPPGRYGLRWRDPLLFVGLPQGIGIDLVRHGYDIVFPEEEAHAVGTWRVGDTPDRPTILVVGGDLRSTTATEGWTLLARHQPRSPAQERRMARLRRAIEADMGITELPDLVGRDADETMLVLSSADPSQVAALRELEALGTPYDVWLVPPEVQN